jgi:hypothetical protein
MQAALRLTSAVGLSHYARHTMPRWLIALVSTLVGLPLLVAAGAPYYLGHVLLGLRNPAWEVAYAVSTLILLVTAIFTIVRFETALIRRAEAAERSRAMLRLTAALATLRSDARLAHWAPLAERYRRVDPDLLEQWEARYQTLRADVRRSAFAERALHGEFPEDHQIDYWLDGGARRTCEHLNAIEGALRDAGATCTPIQGVGPIPLVVTAATLDEPRLRRDFALPDFVQWQIEPAQPHDPGSERLFCTQCQSGLENGRGQVFPKPEVPQLP